MKVAQLFLTILTVVFTGCFGETSEKRTFEVDWDGNQFLKDGEPFRFIAGSFHYFRAHPNSWQRKLRTMRAAGLNAVTTYVEWSLHNPKDSIYIWNGIANLEQFIKYAAQEDLLVILRPGPYICAERDFGGFPYWLLTKYPNIALRTADDDYLYEVRRWYQELMPRMTPYLYGNGGPIIMVQVENEYGSYHACDKKYLHWLRDETLKYVEDNAVLFTNDGPHKLCCGHIDGVLATIDFGRTNKLTSYWTLLRRIQPNGPLVNAEFYPGWLTHWSERMARVNTSNIEPTLVDMLEDSASVNFYVFHGGTNFDFTAGANRRGNVRPQRNITSNRRRPAHYYPYITSYDYDAPMDEAGDPTPKYFALRRIIGQYLPLPNISVPVPLPKMNYGVLHLQACCSILTLQGRRMLSTGMQSAETPMTFEALNQYSGFVLYETFLPRFERDPMVLHISSLHDHAYIYVDNEFVGVLSRSTPAYDLPLLANSGKHLQILVENQGRINFGYLNDFKGIVGNVMLDRLTLKKWNMTQFPLESYGDIAAFVQKESTETPPEIRQLKTRDMLRSGPTIFYGALKITKQSDIGDTYLDTSGWGKGLVFVNGENLGRYWPVAGPQITLYVPREILKVGVNRFVIIENQKAPSSSKMYLTDRPNLDGLK